jgi:hypothetical protein
MCDFSRAGGQKPEGGLVRLIGTGEGAFCTMVRDWTGFLFWNVALGVVKGGGVARVWLAFLLNALFKCISVQVSTGGIALGAPMHENGLVAGQGGRIRARHLNI